MTIGSFPSSCAVIPLATMATADSVGIGIDVAALVTDGMAAAGTATAGRIIKDATPRPRQKLPLDLTSFTKLLHFIISPNWLTGLG